MQGEDIQNVLQGVDHQGAQLQRHEGGHAAEELLHCHGGHLLVVGDEGQPQVLVGVEERRALGQPPAGGRHGSVGVWVAGILTCGCTGYSLLDQLVPGHSTLLLDKVFELRRDEGEAGREEILQSDEAQRREAGAAIQQRKTHWKMVKSKEGGGGGEQSGEFGR